MVYDCIEDGAIEAGDLLVHLYPLDADRTGFVNSSTEMTSAVTVSRMLSASHWSRKLILRVLTETSKTLAARQRPVRELRPRSERLCYSAIEVVARAQIFWAVPVRS